MLQHLRPAVMLTVVFTLLTGVAYPLAITGVAAVIAPGKAGGSLILRDGQPVGSELIGQAFTQPKYFHPRPSATSAPDPSDPSKTLDAPYNAANSSGSNLGPTSRKLIDRVREDADTFRSETGAALVPGDAVTASGSGLDPHVSPQAAFLQAKHVAVARGVPEDRVRAMIEAHIEKPLFGFLGAPRVNVLLLNLDLDRMER